MALVNCPECGKQVSEHANACPNCGFNVKEYYTAKRNETLKIEEYNRTHKPLELGEDDWYKLFSAYEFIVARLAKTTEQLSEYQNIWFNDGVPSYPIDFCNGWYNCIADGYIEIIKAIVDELKGFTSASIRDNIVDLQKYKFLPAMQMTLLRWNRLVMEPFENNTPAVLKKAEHQYNADIAKNSSVGFGIITNSVASMALYAISSSIKEVEAQNQARINKSKYIDSAMSNMQQNVSSAWSKHFSEFLDDVELCHKIVLFEISDIVFKGYSFDWQMVDREYINPERHNAYQNLKKQRLESIEKERRDKAAHLAKKREEYINSNQSHVDNIENKIHHLQDEIDALGFAFLGAKAKKRKELQEQIASLNIQLSSVKPILTATKRPPIVNEEITFTITSGLDAYLALHRSEECTIKYSEKNGYEVFSPSGNKLTSLLFDYVQSFGVHREFSAFVDNCIFDSSEAEIHLIISDKYYEHT